MAATAGKALCDVAAIAALAVASLLAAASMSSGSDRTSDTAVLVYAPWSSTAETLARAAASGARLIRRGRFDFVVLVEPATRASTASGAGAWMMFDATGLGGCLSDGPKASYAAAD